MAQLSSTSVSVVSGDITINAEALALKPGLTFQALKKNMAKGLVRSVAETGLGEDAGRTRLTFRYCARVWRVVLEADGTLVESIAPAAKASLAMTDQPSPLRFVGPAS